MNALVAAVILTCQFPGGVSKECRLVKMRGDNIYVVCENKAKWTNENSCLYKNLPTPQQAAKLERGEHL